MAVLFRCAKGHDWADAIDSNAMETGVISCPHCGSQGEMSPSLLSGLVEFEPIEETLVRNATPAPAEVDHTLVGSSAPLSSSQTDCTLVGSAAPVVPSRMASGSLGGPPPAPGLYPAVAGYEILGELGRGGMGVVYKARQTALGRIVALKMILSGSQAGKDELARFRSEAQAVARLQHPNIVQIFEVGEHSENGVSRPFMALEFVAGGSLSDRLKAPLSMIDGARLIETLARGVQFAHEQGVVHRDLKPANVLMTSPLAPVPDSTIHQSGMGLKESGRGTGKTGGGVGTPKITDFGLAKTLGEGAEHQTHSGQVLGTPAYMAPEQANGGGDVGPLADVYALGVILFQVVTGRLPFVGSALDVMMMHTSQEPPRPSRFAPRLARDLETIILKCLEKDPARRYDSALALAEDLRCFLAHEPILARPVGAGERVVRWVRRRPAVASLLALAAVCVVGLGVTLAITGDAKRRHAAKTREELRTLLTAAQTSAEERSWADAASKLSAARAMAKGESGVADLVAELDELGEEVAGRQEACDAAAAFAKARDEALFLATLAGDAAAAEQTARRVRQALELGGAPDGRCSKSECYLDEKHKNAIREGRYELTLVLADLTEQGRPGRSAEQARAAAVAALAVLDEAAKLGLRTQAFHLRKARYLEGAGDQTRAAAERATAAKLLPSSDLDHYLAGSEYYRRGDLSAAADAFAGSLRLRPKQFWPLYFLALCHVRQGELKAARDDLTNCLAEQKVVWIYLLRGFVEGQLGRYAHAEDDFQKALTILEKQAGGGAKYVLYNNRAVTSLGLRQYAAAEADLRRAIALEPGQYQAHVTLSQVFALQKKHADATASLTRAIDAAVKQHQKQELDDDVLVLLYRSRYRLALETADLAAASADLQAVIDLKHAEPSAKVRAARERGHLFYRQGKLTDALAAYDLAISFAAKDAEPQRWRGEVLLRLKRYEEADKAYSRFLDGGGKPTIGVYRGRALARLQQGQPQMALADFTQAIALAPEDAALRAQRGRTYLACQAYQLAARDFDEAIKRDPNNLQSHQGRALARLQSGQPQQAAEDAERCVTLAPQDARVLYAAACVLAQAAEQGGRAGQKKQQTRAVEMLGESLRLLPEAERSAFWRETVRRDAALRPLRDHEGYSRLDRIHGRTS